MAAAATASEQETLKRLEVEQASNNAKLRAEVEELVLKRCWLSRYWGLAAKLGLYPNIAHKKHAVWAKLAPFPLEVVISAGQEATSLAKESCQPMNCSSKSKEKGAENSPHRAISTSKNCDDILAKGEGSIVSQLLGVDEGLRELAELRVVETVLLTISQNQNPALIWLGLSKDEAEDIRFKQAWLVYYWRRAKDSKVVEEDVAEERLLYWINRSSKQPSYQDAVDVERGMSELESLGIASRLRDASRSASCMTGLLLTS